MGEVIILLSAVAGFEMLHLYSNFMEKEIELQQYLCYSVDTGSSIKVPATTLIWKDAIYTDARNS